RISLGLKQTEDDPWSRLVDQYAPGVETRGRIVRLLDEGVVVDLGDDVEGFVPASQLGVERLKDPADHFREGQELDLRVIESDAVNRRIVLTVTAIPAFETDTPPEGTELTTDAEVRPTPDQVESAAAEAAATDASSITAEVPAAELSPEAGTEEAAAEEAGAEEARPAEAGTEEAGAAAPAEEETV